MRPRLAAAARLVAVIALEVAAIPLLRGRGQAAPAGIDWSHVGRWLGNAPPEDAVVAVVRLVGMVLAGWLLATTTLYLLARLSRIPTLVAGVEWATLPGVRRLVDAAVAASVVGGAIVGAHPAGAQVPAPPPIVVQLDATTTSTPAHLYVPVPAGDGRPVTATTPAATPATPRPATATELLPVPPPAVRPVPAADNTHTVVAGDNLWTIAAAELSRQSGRTPDHLAEAEIRNYWIKVIDANRGRLLSGNPNLIYPGEQIVRPPAD
jgi:nucleoid-associated protein YgaU